MSDINMTPLIDVMLVLVVIFIITAPMLVSSIALDLPRTEAARVAQAAAAVSVTVDAAGQTYANNQAVSLDQLAQQFALTAQANPDTEVQLRADQAVPYGRVVAVMGLAQKAGLNRIGFVAEAKVAAERGSTPAGKP